MNSSWTLIRIFCYQSEHDFPINSHTYQVESSLSGTELLMSDIKYTA